MKQLLSLLVFVMATIITNAQKPTKEDIINALKAKRESAASSIYPKYTLEIHDIKIGTSSKANYKQELEGVPKGALVTFAKIDVTLNGHYTPIQKNRTEESLWVFKDQFGEWNTKTYDSKTKN